MNKFMQLAMEAAHEGMKNGIGGPFGAVIVKNGKVASVACNKVLATNDPAAHAEITVLRKATKKFGSFFISEYEIYSTCEPWYDMFVGIFLPESRSYTTAQTATIQSSATLTTKFSTSLPTKLWTTHSSTNSIWLTKRNVFNFFTNGRGKTTG